MRSDTAAMLDAASSAIGFVGRADGLARSSHTQLDGRAPTWTRSSMLPPGQHRRTGRYVGQRRRTS